MIAQDFDPTNARIIAGLVAVIAGLLVTFKIPVNDELRVGIEFAVTFVVYGPLHKWLAKYYATPPAPTVEPLK